MNNGQLAVWPQNNALPPVVGRHIETAADGNMQQLYLYFVLKIVSDV